MDSIEQLAKILLVPASGVLAFLLLRGDPSGTEGVRSTEVTEADEGEDAGGAVVLGTSTDRPPTSGEAEGPAVAVPPPSPQVGAAESGQVPREVAGVYRDGVVVLTGSVPTQDIAERVERRVGDAFGPSSVESRLSIDPSVEPETFAIFVDQQFPLTISDDDLEQLAELADRALAALPEATVSITGYTDASEAAPHDVALANAAAGLVLDRLVARGIPEDRVEARGASSVTGTAVRDPAARRIEVVFEGIALS